MCEEAINMLTRDPETREKAMRWLCFVQALLWTNGLATITSLKDMNR